MPVYLYKALDGRAATVTGTIAAESPRKARDQLRGRGLAVQSIDERVPDSRLLQWLVRRRTRAAALAGTIRELATLLSVGISLVDALDTLTRQYRGTLRTLLLSLRDRVNAGASLSEGAAEQPELFDELSIRMIEVGEASGNLDTVLHRLADFKERSLEFKDRVVGALLYPAIVLLMSLLVTLFLMVVVLPMLLEQLIESGRPLPWPTRILKWLSDSLLSHGWLLPLLVLLVVVGLSFAVRTRYGSRALARLVSKTPVLGAMTLRQNLARIAYVLSTLLSSGVDFVKAAEIAARATRNPLLRDGLLASSQQIRAGQEIGIAIERAGVFPPMVVQVFTVGQASGQMETMLERLAATYDRQVATLASRIATIVEPVLILFLAVVIGFILFATILPILEAGNVV